MTTRRRTSIALALALALGASTGLTACEVPVHDAASFANREWPVFVAGLNKRDILGQSTTARDTEAYKGEIAISVYISDQVDAARFADVVRRMYEFKPSGDVSTHVLATLGPYTARIDRDEDATARFPEFKWYLDHGIQTGVDVTKPAAVLSGSDAAVLLAEMPLLREHLMSTRGADLELRAAAGGLDILPGTIGTDLTSEYAVVAALQAAAAGSPEKLASVIVKPGSVQAAVRPPLDAESMRAAASGVAAAGGVALTIETDA